MDPLEHREGFAEALLEVLQRLVQVRQPSSETPPAPPSGQEDASKDEEEEITQHGQTAYADLVKDQLAEERDRKKTLEQKGLAVATTTATLVSLLFVISTIVTASRFFTISGIATYFVYGSLACFAIAACCGLGINAVAPYHEAELKDLDDIVKSDTWDLPPREALRDTLTLRLKILGRARLWNNVKAVVLAVGMVLQFFAVGLLALSVVLLVHQFGSHEIFRDDFGSEQLGNLVTGTGTNQFTGEVSKSPLQIVRDDRGSHALQIPLNTNPAYVFRRYDNSYTNHALRFALELAHNFAVARNGQVVIARTESSYPPTSNPGTIDVGIEPGNHLFADYQDDKGKIQHIGSSYVVQPGQWKEIELDETRDSPSGSIAVSVDRQDVIRATGLKLLKGGADEVDVGTVSIRKPSTMEGGFSLENIETRAAA